MTDVDRALSELAARFGLGAPATDQLRALLVCLTADPAAPTTLRDPHAALRDHLADALVALELEPVRTAAFIADLGAGAGIPGLALAIARPDAQVHLIESNRRKCAFIDRAAAAAGLTNAVAVPERAESWSDGLGRCDLVTARALAPLPVVAEYAAPLLRESGSLVAWRGQIDPAEERAAQIAATELGLRYAAPFRVRPYRGAHHRHLQVLEKVSATPPRFPRRPGTARKRPLGAATGSTV